MFNISNHPGEASQNGREIPLRTPRNGHYRNTSQQQVLVRVWIKGNSALLIILPFKILFYVLLFWSVSFVSFLNTNKRCFYAVFIPHNQELVCVYLIHSREFFYGSFFSIFMLFGSFNQLKCFHFSIFHFSYNSLRCMFL